MGNNNLHNAVRIVRAVQAKAAPANQNGGGGLLLGTVLSPPPGITVKLDDIGSTFEKGEILINETLVEHKREKIEIQDKIPGENSISDGEITFKNPILKTGDRIAAALIGRQKVVVIAKVVAP